MNDFLSWWQGGFMFLFAFVANVVALPLCYMCCCCEFSKLPVWIKSSKLTTTNQETQFTATVRGFVFSLMSFEQKQTTQ